MSRGVPSAITEQPHAPLFFHIRNHHERIDDPKGTEFASPEAAHEEAVSAAIEIICSDARYSPRKRMYEIVQGRWNRGHSQHWSNNGHRLQLGLPRERRGGSKRRLALTHYQTAITMRVLVLDDEWLVAALTATILLHAGHDVVGPASSAQEAMQLAVARKPQLALLDIDLHGAGSGLDVAHLCSELGIPAVFVSGSRVSPEERDGAAGSLSKPYLPNDLLQAVEYFRSDCHSSPPFSLELFTPNNLAHRGRPE
jgi:two-component system, response regulator PdtaR